MKNIFKKKKTIEYEDIEYSLKYMYANNNEIKRIFNNMAQAIINIMNDWLYEKTNYPN